MSFEQFLFDPKNEHVLCWLHPETKEIIVARCSDCGAEAWCGLADGDVFEFRHEPWCPSLRQLAVGSV